MVVEWDGLVADVMNITSNNKRQFLDNNCFYKGYHVVDLYYMKILQIKDFFHEIIPM